MTFPQPNRVDYSPRPPGVIGQMRSWGITYWLIAINVAIFVVDQMAGGLLSRWGYFSEFTAIQHWQLWRFLTFQFLHVNISHIFFNMLSLYFFGPLVENWLGRRKFLAYYLICGASGAASYLILWRLGLIIASSLSPLVGASAGIFGVLIACVKIAPDLTVRMLFPPIAMKMKTMAWVFIGIAVFTIVSQGNNAGGEAAHLGGALVGWVLISNHQWLNIFEGRKRTARFWKPGDSGENFLR